MKTPEIVSDFRAALAKGELHIQNCGDCGKPNMWPRYACPHCQSENLGWVKSVGKGQLHSFCVLRQGAPEGFEDDLPYVIGVVKLDEGSSFWCGSRPTAKMIGRLTHATIWSNLSRSMQVQSSVVPAQHSGA